MTLPFQMRQESPIEKWRALTFWTKEPETIAWIQSFNTADAFIDVGANVGIYSLFAASLYPKMSIFAVEPSRFNFEALERNCKLNGYGNAQCYNMGAGETFGNACFHDTDFMAGASGGHMGARGYVVPVTTLAGIMRWHQKDEWYNIKIDTDGGELAILRGIKSEWARVRSVLIEVNDNKDKIIKLFHYNGLTMANRFNVMTPHSRERRKTEKIPEENIVFTRSL